MSFDLRAGEILGVAGLQGMGQLELFSALFGMEEARGTIIVDGRPVTFTSPRDALDAGIGLGLVPEDRKTEALFLKLDGQRNAALPCVERYSRGGLIDEAREEADAARVFTRLNVDAHPGGGRVGIVSSAGPLEAALATATATVAQLKAEVASDPGSANARTRAARERAAREREARIAAALTQQSAIEALRKKRETTNTAEVAKQKPPRSSTTDPEARVMKMADGGFRPAWNGQIVTVAQGQIVIAVDAVAVGSDRGLMRPMLETVIRRFGIVPQRILHDGGFTRHEDTVWADRPGTAIYAPAPKSRHKTAPYAPRPRDKPAVAAWRCRMASP